MWVLLLLGLGAHLFAMYVQAQMRGARGRNSLPGLQDRWGKKGGSADLFSGMMPPGMGTGPGQDLGGGAGGGLGGGAAGGLGGGVGGLPSLAETMWSG